MMMLRTYGFRLFAVGLAAYLFLLVSTPDANAQRRDHLTDKEVELIKEHQSIDKRMEVFIRAIERRFLAIEGTSGLDKDGLKKLEKETDKWGELPEGSRSDLISDISDILDEAIDKIDDVADRDSKSVTFRSAVFMLADAAKGFQPVLQEYRDNSAASRDAAKLTSALRFCSDIIDASSQVERPSDQEVKQDKKKKKN